LTIFSFFLSSDAFLQKADLSALSLHHKCLVNCDLRGADMTRARLLKVTLIGVWRLNEWQWRGGSGTSR
jgi:hypothetical protein